MMLLELLNEVVDIDTDIFLSINRMHSPFFDYFMSTYSGKWIWIPMYAAIWYVMLRNFHWKVTLFCMVGLALVITFGLAFFVWFLFRKRWLTVFMMGWALLTCYSRIYLGVHYPGDLIVGTLIGLLAAYIVYRLFLKVSGYKTMKKVPHIYAPILVGGLTIVGILIYSTVMIL